MHSPRCSFSQGPHQGPILLFPLKAIQVLRPPLTFLPLTFQGWDLPAVTIPPAVEVAFLIVLSDGCHRI